MSIWAILEFSIIDGDIYTNIFTISEIEITLYDQIQYYFDELQNSKTKIDNSILGFLPRKNYIFSKFPKLKKISESELEIFQKYFEFVDNSYNSSGLVDSLYTYNLFIAMDFFSNF